MSSFYNYANGKRKYDLYRNQLSTCPICGQRASVYRNGNGIGFEAVHEELILLGIPSTTLCCRRILNADGTVTDKRNLRRAPTGWVAESESTTAAHDRRSQ